MKRAEWHGLTGWGRGVKGVDERTDFGGEPAIERGLRSIGHKAFQGDA